MSTAAHSSEPISSDQVPLPTTEQLPDDPDTLKQMIVELLTTLRQERRDKEDLRQRLHLLLQRLYGSRSERFNPNQLLLFADGQTPTAGACSQPADAETQDEPEPTKRTQRRRGHGRRRMPEDLPRRPVHHELTAAERLCVCGATRIDIGTENAGEQLDWQPASYFVWRH